MVSHINTIYFLSFQRSGKQDSLAEWSSVANMILAWQGRIDITQVELQSKIALALILIFTLFTVLIHLLEESTLHWSNNSSLSYSYCKSEYWLYCITVSSCDVNQAQLLLFPSNDWQLQFAMKIVITLKTCFIKGQILLFLQNIFNHKVATKLEQSQFWSAFLERFCTKIFCRNLNNLIILFIILKIMKTRCVLLLYRVLMVIPGVLQLLLP